MRQFICITALFLAMVGISTKVLHAQAQISVTMSATPACSLDGSASASVTGGLPPYTYVWHTNAGSITTSNSTLTGLPCGYIAVDIHDSNPWGGMAQAAVIVPGPFEISATSTNETCGDGTGTARAMVVTGGFPPFTFAWSNGNNGPIITGLNQGAYSVSVSDAIGCVVDSGLTTYVGNSSTITATINSTPSMCNDGTLSISNLAGGTAPYTYSWGTTPVQNTPIATNVPGNTLGMVTITDATGCMWTDLFWVAQAAGSMSLSFTKVDETCVQGNGSATVSPINGIPPLSYLWSTGDTTQTISGLSYGNYVVTVTDASNCAVSGSVDIQRTDPLTLDFSAIQPNCNNTGGSITLTVTGGAGPYSYLWNNGNTAATLNNLPVDYYHVSVQDSNGCYDHATFHLRPDTACFGMISGSIVGDRNQNCVMDAGDFPMRDRWVSLGSVFAYTDPMGNYSASVLPGTYPVSQAFAAPHFVQACPASPGGYTVSVSQQQAIHNQDFFNQPTGTIDDLSVELFAGPARPAAPQYVYFYYHNNGTTSLNATVEYVHDPLMTLMSGGSQMTAYNSATRTLTYHLGILDPFETGMIQLAFTIPTSTQLGTPYSQQIDIFPQSSDATPANNQLIVPGIVVTSFDPNAKSVFPGPQITVDDTVLTYTVQFQNTGNDTAFTVAISDTIDPNLDMMTLEVLGATHAYTVDATAPNVVNFRFANIMLPDSNINEPLSHGHILYRIHTKPNLSLGTEIRNTAYIYFDYNTPVVTNTTINTITAVGEREPQSELGSSFALYPNPASGEVTLRLTDNWAGRLEINLRDLSGRLLLQKAMHPNEEREVQLDLQGLTAGVYLVECMAKGQRMVRKLVVQ